MFQIKDFRSIVTSMINRAKATQSKLTDWSVGSVARTMVEAPAAEIEELYLQMLLGLQEAMPVAVYQAFGFERLGGLSATGVVRFSATAALPNDAPIPAGTSVKSPGSGAVYSTQADAVLLAGQTVVDVLVACDSAGEAGNAAIGSVTEIVTSVSGLTAVQNLTPLTGGRSEETDAQRKARFFSYISTLSRSTSAALRYGAETAFLRGPLGDITERVTHVEVVEPYILDAAQPPGQATVYVHNGVGGTSPELVTEVLKVLNGYRGADGKWVAGFKAAGIKTTVLACPEVLVGVTADIDFGGGVPDFDAASAEARSYIASLPVGAAVLRSGLIARVMQLPGVRNVTLTAPASDVSVLAYAKAMPGAVTLT